MRAQSTGKNTTIVHVANIVILVSYDTPVAYFNTATGKHFITAEKHSATTTRHINKWLDGAEAETKPQSEFNTLLNP